MPVYIRYLYEYISKLDRNSAELERISKEMKKITVFISGGDKISEKELILWQDVFNVPILNGYGNNEVAGAAILSPMNANKPGSVGIAMYGKSIKM